MTNLSSQEENLYRIGLDYKSKLKIFGLSANEKNGIENVIRASFSKTLSLAKQYNWDSSFEQIAQNMFESIIREQKNLEELAECLDETCAITLGKLASAKYMIYRDILLIGKDYTISLQFINIETGTTQHSVNGFYSDRLVTKGGQEFFDNLMIELFNGAFPNEPPLPSSSRNLVIAPDNEYSPIADNQIVKIPHSKPYEIKLTASDKDGDDLLFELISSKTDNASMRIKNGNTLLYSPKQNFIGEDEVGFRVSDGLYSTPGKVIFNVINRQPTSNNKSVAVDSGDSIDIYPFLKDLDGDPLKIKAIDYPKKGDLRTRGNRFIYSPKSGAKGSDEFTFIVNDSISNSIKYTVFIKIIPPNNSVNDSKNNDEDGGPNLLMILGAILLLGLLAGGGGGGSDGGSGSGTGTVDIGIITP